MIYSNVVRSKSVRFSSVDGKSEVGHAWLYIIKNDQHEQPYGLLEDVWVSPESRHQGRASQLVEAVIHRANEEGCYKIIATSRFERKKVHEMYKGFGFVLHGHEFRMDF